MQRLRPRLGLAVGVLVVTALVVGQAHSKNETEEITLQTADGVTIAGTYYRPSKAGPRPAVILLHMLSRNREDWKDFAQVLAWEGYAVVAIDLRGHGESTRGAGSWRLLKQEGFRAMVEDVAAAHQYLRRAPEADGGSLALVGASIGANVALLYASREPAVKTLVLLSPGLDYRGVATAEAMSAYGTRPVLIAASSEDTYAADSSTALNGLAQGRHKLVMYNGAGHGTHMFAKEPTMEGMLLEWLGSSY